MAHAPHTPSAAIPAIPALVPGAGCLSGAWVLALTGAPIRCVDPKAPVTRAPAPLAAAAAVDAVLDGLPAGALPASVIVGADVDPLAAGPEWDEAAFAAASRLVERRVPVTLCTRGAPGEGGAGRAWDALLRRGAAGAGACLEVRLFTLDAALAAVYEPEVPSPSRRLEAARRLAAEGVHVEARLAPLLPWISDTTAHLDALVHALGRVGVRRVRAAYLHLEGRGGRRLRRLPKAHRALLRSCLAEAPVHPGEARLLPAALRVQGHRRLARLAAVAGIVATPCHEAGPDLADGCACFTPAPAARATVSAVRAAVQSGGEAARRPGVPRGASQVPPEVAAAPRPRRGRRPSKASADGAQLALFG